MSGTSTTPVEPQRLRNSFYLSSIFSGAKTYNDVVDAVCERLKDKDFDFIAFRGFSGAMVAVGVAAKLDKGLLLCRKTDESGAGNSHGAPLQATFMPDGRPPEPKKILVFDDFTSSGNTFRCIFKRLKEYGLDDKVVAYFLYERLKLTYLVSGVPDLPIWSNPE